MFEEVGAELGYSAKSRSAFLALLEDREPNPAQAAVLARYFGEPSEEPAPVASSDAATPFSELAALLVAQTKAITDLVDELRQERSARTTVEARLEQVEATLDLLVAQAPGAPGTPAPLERGAPQT